MPKYKITGGYIILEPVETSLKEISLKLMKIAEKETKDLEVDLKREGNPENLI